MIDSNQPRRHEQFYGFRERPFFLLPDPGFLYMSEKHRTALDLLELSVINQSGFCVISGDIGVGKTTLVRELLNRLDDNIRVGMVTNTRPSFDELLQLIMASFGLEYDADDKSELHKRFIDFTIAQYAERKHTLLIIDEAQHLSVPALEELRMLSNINADKDLLLQVILVGQKELHDKLTRPELAQFAQRIAIDYHLTGLDEQETGAYIRYRVSHAGGSPDLFSGDACSTVFHLSEGIPRLINRICGLSLVYGYAEQSHVITPELVTAVARDQHIGNLQKVPGGLSKRGAAAFTKVVRPNTGDETGPVVNGNNAALETNPVPEATRTNEIEILAPKEIPAPQEIIAREEITVLEEIPAPKEMPAPQKEAAVGNDEALAAADTGRKPAGPVAATTAANRDPDLPRHVFHAGASGAGGRTVPDSHSPEFPGVDVLVAEREKNSGSRGKLRGASWVLGGVVIVAGAAGWFYQDYQNAMQVVDAVPVKPSIQPPPIARRSKPPAPESAGAVIQAQPGADRMQEQRRQAERELAEQRAAERMEQARRQAEQELAEQRAAERVEQERRQAERELAEQRAAERVEQERRQAERKLARQRAAERVAQERRQAELELRELGKLWEQESQQLRKESSREDRRSAAEARWKQWSKETGWSDDAAP